MKSRKRTQGRAHIVGPKTSLRSDERPEPPRTKSVMPHVTHEGAIEQAIGMFLGYPEWYEIPQKARDRIWGSLRWLVDQTHGVKSPAPFGNVNDDPTAPRLCVPPSDEKA